MIKSQENDIKDMISKMRFQFSDLREKYLFELEEIENEFSNEVFIYNSLSVYFILICDITII